MRLSCRTLASLFVATALPMIGCASDELREKTAFTEPIEPAYETHIEFDPPTSVALSPREERTLTIITDPPGPFKVAFALLGDSLDATLDRVEGVTDHQGHASVKIRAPNKTAAFRLRAWIPGDAATEVPIAVSGEGFASVAITPIYKGTRPIAEWTAEIVARSYCSDIAPLLPDKTPPALTATVPSDQPLIVKDVPVGPNVAIAVRAGRFAWGCTDTNDLISGEESPVKVNVVDKPVVVGETDLDLTLSFLPAPDPFLKMLNNATTALLDAFLPAGDAAAPVLLDAMAKELPEAEAALFADTRASLGWDAVTTNHLASLPMSMRSVLEAWTLQGSAAQPPELEGRITAVPGVPGFATFAAKRIGLVPADEAGMPGVHLVSLTSDPSDNVQLGGSLFWLPTRYVGGVCKQRALDGAPEDKTMTDALGAVADCDALSVSLGGFDTCDATCLAGLCRQALQKRWDAALDVSALGGQIGMIEMTAAGSVMVDDTAVPISMSGSWLGSVNDGSITAKIEKAAVTATTPPLPEPP